jgi:hypothetical protein
MLILLPSLKRVRPGQAIGHNHMFGLQQFVIDKPI